jgi:hypothetical protein
VGLALYFLSIINCSVSLILHFILLQPIVTLSFAGKSEYLVSVSRGSKPQLAVWSMSKLSLCWSYKLHIEGLEILISFHAESSFLV